MNNERKTNNPGSLVEKIATGKANALEIDHDDLLIGMFNFILDIWSSDSVSLNAGANALVLMHWY